MKYPMDNSFMYPIKVTLYTTNPNFQEQILIGEWSMYCRWLLGLKVSKGQRNTISMSTVLLPKVSEFGTWVRSKREVEFVNVNRICWCVQCLVKEEMSVEKLWMERW